jgi:hypothetical protein
LERWPYVPTIPHLPSTLLTFLSCQLFIEGARMDEPIAWHNRHKKVVVDGTPMLRPAAMGLGVDASRLPFRDQIVISWMLVSERTTIAAPV